MKSIVHSPCNSHCFIPPGSDLCTGCFRTIREIIGWLSFPDLQKKEILQKIEQRKREYGKIK